MIGGFFILKHVSIVDAMNEVAPITISELWSGEKQSKWQICIR